MNTFTQQYFDSEEYYERLRIKNKIICSYSRLESFLQAQPNVVAAEQYTIVANMSCPHNYVYVYDEEGICTTYILVEEAKEPM